MKRFIITTIAAMLIAGISPVASAETPSVLLEKGIYAEQTKGDLDEAIGIYKQIVDSAEANQRYVAEAHYRLGMCQLKKGDKQAAAASFRKVLADFSSQRSLANKARKELTKLDPLSGQQRLPEAVMSYISGLHLQTVEQAWEDALFSNSHIYRVDPGFNLYSGGLMTVQNHTNKPMTEEMGISNSSYNDLLITDKLGVPQESRMVDRKAKSGGKYRLFWTPDRPVAPGETRLLGWLTDKTQPLRAVRGGGRRLKMKNTPGPPTRENFFLVIPTFMNVVSPSRDYVSRKRIGMFDVYLWQRDVPANTKNQVTLVLKLGQSEALDVQQVAKIVADAVMTISTCGETDPRVKPALASMDGLDDLTVAKELAKFLDSEKNTIRRSAIYILWMGSLVEITPAVPGLQKLCKHEEDLTRGMAAIALGAHKIDSSFQTICDMTLNDESPYARRCAAYALGLTGRLDAKPILEKALKDKEAFVRNNAEAALTMLELSKDNRSTAVPASRTSKDQVVVEDLALEMLVAIREKDNTALKAGSVDRIQGWRDAWPHFSLELRERFRQMTGKPFTMYPAWSIVRGEVAAVKCTGPKELKGVYFVLFFVRTHSGWKNFSMRNSPPSVPLETHLRKAAKAIGVQLAASQPAAPLGQSSKDIETQTAEISDSEPTALDLDTGKLHQLTARTWPDQYELGWDNDVGGMLMVKPRKRGKPTGLLSLPEAKSLQEAVARVKGSQMQRLLDHSMERGVPALRSRFSAVRTNEGRIAVIEVTRFDRNSATLQWTLVNNGPKR